MPQGGEVYHYPGYVFPDNATKDKYVVLMGQTISGDWIVARTTSRGNGRSINPACSYGPPYSSFFLGKIQDIFVRDTWLVLDRLDDHDERDFDQKIATKGINLIKPLPTQVFCEALTCAMAAEAATRQQERAMHDLRAGLRCIG